MHYWIGKKRFVGLVAICFLLLLTSTFHPTFASAPSCTINYQIDWSNDAEFGASVTIHNATTTPINGWEVGWEFDGQQQISLLWNGSLTQTDAAVRVSDANWNGTINPDEAVSFGFQGTHDGTNDIPTQLTLNGELCNEEAPQTAAAESLLAIYALAFDTPHSSNNLSQYYAASLQSIINATEGADNVTAVVLIDLDGQNDSHIFVFHNGEGSFIEGLPDTAGQLTTDIQEYNMADGQQLGGFLQWARATYPASETSFSYVGHGTALAPETDLSAFVTVPEEFEDAEDEGIPTTPWVVDVNPWVVDVNPWVVDVNPWVVDVNPWVVDVNPWVVDVNTSWTDEHTGDAAAPVALLTPYDLATALEIATADGSDPITVLDTLHCFGGTIEQLYELSNPGATPYAERILSSPNYHYFAPPLLGAGLEAMTTAPVDEIATELAEAYDSVMETADFSNEGQLHPRSVVLVESADIPAVKAAVDDLATVLVDRFDQSAVATKDLLSVAYQESGTYYDTTYCEQDYELGPPDALVDITSLMRALGDQFGAASDVGLATQAVSSAVNNAIVGRQTTDGTPWFAPEGTAEWVFSAEDSSGIAIYADFGGRTGGNVPINERYLAWLAPFYADAPILFNNINLNEHPYQFVQGDTTWANVFVNYWATKTDHEALTLQSELCTPSIAPTQPELGGKRVVGVYAAEDVSQRDYLPADIPVDNLTHLNYTAVVPQWVDGQYECAIADTYTAYDLPLSRLVAWTHDNDHIGVLNQLRLLRDYHPHIKLLLSLSGTDLTTIAADADLSQSFAASCAALVEQELFDGLNVAATPEAVTLLTALRDVMPADTLLTVDGGTMVSADIAPLVDWVNLSASETHALPDTSAIVQSWLDAGVPAEKLTLGLSYQGHDNNGDSYDYWEIALNYVPHPAYTTRWDDAQAIPTTTNGSQAFVYENADSVAAKAAYAQQIGGMTLWDLAAEGRPGLPDAPLTTAITTALATVE